MRAAALVIGVIVAAACGGARPTAVTATDRPTPTTVTETPVPSPSPTVAATATPAPSGLLAMTLTDVRTGETFSLGQFGGRVTLVQHMAVW